MKNVTLSVPQCTLLKGANIKPATAKQARALIGMRVQYLQTANIDKTGRGMFFPRIGVIVSVYGKNVAMDEPDNYCVNLNDLVEMVELKS